MKALLKKILPKSAYKKYKRRQLYWIRYREGIILTFCLLVLLVIGLAVLSFLAENYPFISLGVILSVAFVYYFYKHCIKAYL